MRAVDIIQKKRDKINLSKEEIEFFLSNYHKKNIPDYQMSAFLMAVFFNGMTKEELKYFTEEMINSGDIITFEGINKFLIDKHSTGGVGDKTTIALAPIFAACGIGTAKLSGRGLGHTGGTIDKFESIPGFKFPETKEEMVSIVNKTGIGVMGYSDKIVPLDKMLYALRDVTATVESIPLIASSIMSKKLAVHADGIILDVKVGSGAFMKKYEDACLLADTMIEIGKSFGREIVAVMTDMDKPLGNAIGNSLEVIEAIETLKGNGPKDFTELIVTLAAIGLILKKDYDNIEEAKSKIKEVLKTGRPLEMLGKFIKECNGNEKIIYDYDLLPKAKNVMTIKSTKKGYISKLYAEEIGKAAMILGAGREKKEDRIDYSVGIVMKNSVGDFIDIGEDIAIIHYNDIDKVEVAKEKILNSVEIVEKKIEKKEIIIDIRR